MAVVLVVGSALLQPARAVAPDETTAKTTTSQESVKESAAKPGKAAAKLKKESPYAKANKRHAQEAAASGAKPVPSSTPRVRRVDG